MNHVLSLVLKQFEEDCPFVVSRLDALRPAAQTRGPACGDTACAEGAGFSAVPDGNHGDNKTNLTDKAFL